MPYRKTPWILFVVALIIAAYYVLHTSPTLPPLVASHFDASGTANAFMARDSYGHFMLFMSVGFPLRLVRRHAELDDVLRASPGIARKRAHAAAFGGETGNGGGIGIFPDYRRLDLRTDGGLSPALDQRNTAVRLISGTAASALDKGQSCLALAAIF